MLGFTSNNFIKTLGPLYTVQTNNYRHVDCLFGHEIFGIRKIKMSTLKVPQFIKPTKIQLQSVPRTKITVLYSAA